MAAKRNIMCLQNLQLHVDPFFFICLIHSLTPGCINLPNFFIRLKRSTDVAWNKACLLTSWSDGYHADSSQRNAVGGVLGEHFQPDVTDGDEEKNGNRHNVAKRDSQLQTECFDKSVGSNNTEESHNNVSQAHVKLDCGPRKSGLPKDKI